MVAKFDINKVKEVIDNILTGSFTHYFDTDVDKLTYEQVKKVLLGQITSLNKNEVKVVDAYLCLHCNFMHSTHFKRIEALLDDKLADVPELLEQVKELRKDVYGTATDSEQ